MTFRFNFLSILFAFTISTLAVTICAAQAKDEPVTIVTHVDIIPDAYKPMSEENAVRLFRNEAAATKHDVGLISFVLLQENGLSNHFTILETWLDTRSYEMHQGSDHTIEFRKDLQPFIGSPFDARKNHPLR
jgi:quinol monooxygenase YgiN